MSSIWVAYRDGQARLVAFAPTAEALLGQVKVVWGETVDAKVVAADTAPIEDLLRCILLLQAEMGLRALSEILHGERARAIAKKEEDDKRKAGLWVPGREL